MRPEDLMATSTATARIVGVNPLETIEQVNQATALLQALHNVRQEGDEARKEEKAPHLRAGRAVDDRYRPALKEIDRVIGLIKDRLAERALRIEAERARALSAPVEEANAALAVLPEQAVPAGVQDRWSWEVDSVDLSKVPLEFLTLDQAKVKAYLKGRVEEPSIAGLTFRRAVNIITRRTR